MRVAFTLLGGKDWTGGSNYLRNLLQVVSQYGAGNLTPVLFADPSIPDSERRTWEAIPGVELVLDPAFASSRRTASLLQAIFIGQDIRFVRLLKEFRIDVVFESAQFFGWRIGMPAMAWIPDFQHRSLPHLFSRLGWWRREIGFRMQVFAGRSVMLSSDDARTSCERFYPSSLGRTKTIRFAVRPGLLPALDAARALANSYGLPEHFFFLPNQFWRHKNHELVLDALEILRQRGASIVVAASGRQADPRDPAYFPAFHARLVASGLQDSFRLLGMIPYPHLEMLMRASSALLNPSLFEGWSTTVEEARWMGTPMLLSNLPVHREQMGEDALYFDRHSAGSLADALHGFVPLDPERRLARANKGRVESLNRVEQFAKDFSDFAAKCCVAG